MKGKNMNKISTSEKTDTTVLNTRLPNGLIKRIKAFCDDNDITIQDFITDAIIEKLELVHKERRKRPRL